MSGSLRFTGCISRGKWIERQECDTAWLGCAAVNYSVPDRKLCCVEAAKENRYSLSR